MSACQALRDPQSFREPYRPFLSNENGSRRNWKRRMQPFPPGCKPLPPDPSLMLNSRKKRGKPAQNSVSKCIHGWQRLYRRFSKTSQSLLQPMSVKDARTLEEMHTLFECSSCECACRLSQPKLQREFSEPAPNWNDRSAHWGQLLHLRKLHANSQPVYVCRKGEQSQRRTGFAVR